MLMPKKLKKKLETFKQEIAVYQRVLKHERTPRISKFLLGCAVAYALNPFDLIPDFIPLLGLLDDAILVPLLVFLAIKSTPKQIIEECRDQIP